MEPWMISALIAVFFGGFAGSVLTNLIAARKGRKQPVWYDVSVTSVFKSLKLPGMHKVTVAMSDKDENTIFSIDNLYIARIDLINNGNKDFEAFTFHVSVTDVAKIIAIDKSTQGAQHEIHYSPTIALNSSIDNITIKCDPFNRKDVYSFTLYLTSLNNEPLSVNQLKLDTKHPVDLVLANRLDELNKESPFSAISTFLLNAIVMALISAIAIATIFNKVLGVSFNGIFVEKNKKGTMVTTKSLSDSSSVDTFIISGDKAYRLEKPKK